MDRKYRLLKKWFYENYGGFGYNLSDLYIDEQNLKYRFNIERFGKKTKMLDLLILFLKRMFSNTLSLLTWGLPY